MTELNLIPNNIKRANDYLLDDMATFLDYLFRKGGIKTANGLILPANIKELAPNLIYPMELKRQNKETNIPYMFVMDMICRIMGLTDMQAGILFARGSLVDDFNDMSDEEKMRKIYASYINNRLINEIKFTPKLKIEWKDKSQIKKMLINFRKSIYSVLSECEAHYWY